MAEEAAPSEFAAVGSHSHIPGGLDGYKKMYARSLEEPEAFWGEQALSLVDWFRPFDAVQSGELSVGDIAWFTGGKLNVSYNCVDRHVQAGRGDDVAILWEGDEPEDVRRITFLQLQRSVCRVANVLKSHGVRKGDCVAIYMPMIPEAAFTMLACARLGAPHSVVFAGFSAEALRDRVVDASCKWVVTSDVGKRGGRVLQAKRIVDEAVAGVACVQHVFMFRHDAEEEVEVGWTEGRDVAITDLLAEARPYCPPEHMDAEDTLFLLYTSGSTGKPKGVLHTTAGYLVWTTLTHRLVFDYRPGDVYACVADIGWITGHSYIVYGPLSNGATTFMFESTPTYPTASRYWQMVDRHRITQFYTAPTAIRTLMRAGDEPVAAADRSSLRVLGTVGEPINPEAWRWYFDVVGQRKAAIVDTYWQTETGGIMATPLPGIHAMRPGACMVPFLGIDFRMMNDAGEVIDDDDVEGVLCVARPWPGMARTVHNNHSRYLRTYMDVYPGHYFTGDGARRDADGYYWITGRVDDVMNISGHRIGTAEVESALVACDGIAEAAVIAYAHDVKGWAMGCYVTPVEGVEPSEELRATLRAQVRRVIGPFATPDLIIMTPALPKTRSGKIMRRILRKIIVGDSLGDVSTIADSTVVSVLVDRVQQAKDAKAAAKKA
eukprot:PLAT6433.18.p1 GENE.PLAT6433.18~~PLAT6433.18.p1  ORF type:complete len:678 (+),score=278.46 PLAT6433.18:53-2035(+)